MLVEAIHEMSAGRIEAKKAGNKNYVYILKAKSSSDKFQKNNSPDNDGKFSFKEAGKNFVKGLISPITGMFSSPANFAISAGAILATAGLYAIGLGPAVIALWTIYGVVQGASSLHNIATNKNPDEKEKAFFDLGEATFCAGTSVLCAKATVKDFGINTSNISSLKATAECFKLTPKAFANTAKNIKSIGSPLNFFKKSAGQIDYSSITDAYGKVVAVKGMKAGRVGTSLNLHREKED